MTARPGEMAVALRQWPMQAAMLALCALLGATVAFRGLTGAVAAFGVLAVLGALRWPLGTVLLLIAYIPVEGFLVKWIAPEAGGVVTLMPEILTWACALSVVVSRANRLDRKAAVLWMALIAGFALVGAVSALVNGIGWFPALYWVRTIIRFMPVALVVGALVDGRVWLRRVAPLIGVSMVVQAGVALAELLGGNAARLFFAPGDVVVGGTRFVGYEATALSGISGTMGFYNTLGVYSVLCFVVCAGAGYAMRERRHSGGDDRLWIFLVRAGTVAAVAGVLMAGSRQSMVAFLAALVLLVVLLGMRGLGWEGTPAALGVGGVTAAAFVWPSLASPLRWIPERFAIAFSAAFIAQSSQSDRLFAILRVVPAVFRKAPLLGVGPGGLSADSVAAAAGKLGLSYVGVLYVQDVGWAGLFAQTGLLGLALVLGALAWVGARAWGARRARVLDRGLFATVAMVLAVVGIGMFASSILFVRSLSFVLWVVVGLTFRREPLDTVGPGSES